MSKNKNSPGWLKVVRDPENGGFHVFGPEINRFEPPEPIASFETDAAAQLFAAAPEMLAALVAVLDDYRRPDWRNLKANIALMEAAIAKAEGK